MDVEGKDAGWCFMIYIQDAIIGGIAKHAPKGRWGAMSSTGIPLNGEQGPASTVDNVSEFSSSALQSRCFDCTS